ncbi:acyl-coenzyme A thioesterase 5-like [Portunus trituberculatus]|uniref:acyl-coenzyme A thioesterase 5-like n=1 Tax=Portunus trituberculatus TaxID=210409 RepID=UPI001E1CF1F3|nr:acyl-coenzyme A thioesterase 5-like [Portunus trituberculatus]
MCLHDAPTSIMVKGMQPQAPVTLTLTTHNEASLKFLSYAHYVSDDSGTVNVERSEAVGGSYTGEFPAGLLLSLMEFPHHYTRLQKDDPTTPWLMTLAVHEGHLTLEQSGASEGLTDVLLERHIMAPGVRSETVVLERVRGNIFFPAGPGPYPAAIDIFGASGGLKEYRAFMLASRGIACLAIAYFKYADLPKNLDSLELEYFEEAVEYLLQQPGVIPARCGVIGSSKGANPTLGMGIHLPKVTAVVSIGGKLIGDTPLTYRGKQLWKTQKLNPLYYQIEEHNIVSVKESAVKNLYTHDHPGIPNCEDAPDDTHFLLIAGDDDQCYTKLEIDALMDRMKLHGREHQCQTVIYKEAGHIIEPPYNAHPGYSTFDMGLAKVIMKWGGIPWGTCKAQEHNWNNMKNFLEMHVRDRSAWYQQYIDRTRTEKKL